MSPLRIALVLDYASLWPKIDYVHLYTYQDCWYWVRVGQVLTLYSYVLLAWFRDVGLTFILSRYLITQVWMETSGSEANMSKLCKRWVVSSLWWACSPIFCHMGVWPFSTFFVDECCRHPILSGTYLNGRIWLIKSKWIDLPQYKSLFSKIKSK